MIRESRTEEDASEAATHERVLVDSSLWIEYYQPEGRVEVRAAVQEALARDRVGTMALILVEVLRGALSQESYQELEADLGALHWLDITPGVARRASEIGLGLERKGKRVPATDLLIAGTAIEHDHTVWHNDGHFEVIGEHSALRQRRFPHRDRESRPGR